VTSDSYRSGFRVAKSSVLEIRARAMSVRDILIPNGIPDLELFVESLENFGITYVVVEEGYLPALVEASCIPDKRVIYITASTYDDVIRNGDRARFTIFHELGHLLLAHSRNFHRDTTVSFPVYENSEWQADQFAAEILMPLDQILAKNLTVAGELQKEFGVSYTAASIRLAKLRGRREIKNA
jgi:Zn-dependent peptidase ImmA (M78 family)